VGERKVQPTDTQRHKTPETMANNAVMMYDAFDPKDIVFSGVEKTKKGGKIVYLGVGPEGKNRIVVQTPPMPMPFGITPYQESPGGEIQSYSVDVSFRTADADPRVRAFLDTIKALDDRLIDVATKNSAEWFGKKMPRDLVEEFYRKLLKQNPQYPPILKAKVGISASGEPTALFFDENRAPTGIEYLTKGCTIRMICELSSVWFVNKTFGATFRLVQAAVAEKPRRLDGYSFQEEDNQGPAAAAAPMDTPVEDES
jgi:hypothetical protein